MIVDRLLRSMAIVVGVGVGMTACSGVDQPNPPYDLTPYGTDHRTYILRDPGFGRLSDSLPFVQKLPFSKVEFALSRASLVVTLCVNNGGIARVMSEGNAEPINKTLPIFDGQCGKEEIPKIRENTTIHIGFAADCYSSYFNMRKYGVTDKSNSFGGSYRGPHSEVPSHPTVAPNFPEVNGDCR